MSIELFLLSSGRVLFAVLVLVLLVAAVGVARRGRALVAVIAASTGLAIHSFGTFLYRGLAFAAYPWSELLAIASYGFVAAVFIYFYREYRRREVGE